MAHGVDHLYDHRGAQYKGWGTEFQLYLPGAQWVNVELLGDDGRREVVPMHQVAFGVWKVAKEHVGPGQRYLYEVGFEREIKHITDPFAFKNVKEVASGHLHSMVEDRGAFHWTDGEHRDHRARTSSKGQPLSIFEVQLDALRGDGTTNLKTLAHDVIAHCHHMGYTHVELSALMEGGYQMSHPFAIKHTHGGLYEMKEFVNALHGAGLGVILDWVPAHYDHKHSPMGAVYGTHEFSSGEWTHWDTEYIDFTKGEACRMMEASALWWIHELHLDGLRVDHASRILTSPGGYFFMQNLNRRIANEAPHTMMIAEMAHYDGALTSWDGAAFTHQWNSGGEWEMKAYLEGKKEHWMLEKLVQEGKDDWRGFISTHCHDNHSLGFMGMSIAERCNHLVRLILGPSYGNLVWMHSDDGDTKEFLRSLLHYYREREDFWKFGPGNTELVYSYADNGIIAWSRGHNLVIQNNSGTFYDEYILDAPKGEGWTPKFAATIQTEGAGNGEVWNEGGKLKVRLPPNSSVILENR